MKRWIFRNLIAFDQWLNAAFYPLLNWAAGLEDCFGYPDETLSSVFAKNVQSSRFCYWMCRLLHIFDKGHCDTSIEHDEGQKVRDHKISHD